MSIFAKCQGGGVSDHGALTGLLDDDHTQYLLLAGRSGGQTAFGGLLASEGLTLAANAAGNDGILRFDSEVNVNFDPTGTGLTHFFNVTSTYTGAAGLNGGFNYSPNITVTSAVSIIEAIRGLPTVTQEAATAFSAFTLFQSLPVVRTVNASFNPMQALILNAGPVSEVAAAINPPANPSLQAVNFAPQTRATVSGATSSVTTQIGLRVAPTFSTVSGSTANLGTITGLQCSNPVVGLFQPQAGVETLTAYIGVDIDAIPFGGNVTKRALRSALTAASNTLFLENTGGARSEFNSGSIAFNDLAGVVFGTSDDFNIGWGAANFYFWNFASSGDQLRFSNPSASRFLFTDDTGAAELNFNCARFSLGAQTGAVGNQVGVFVAGTRSTSVAGEWSDFLLTQGGNITLNAAMSGVFGWTINAPSITLGTGSVTTAGALNIGGNVNQGSVNRFGVRILSNPSGGSGVNAALWVTAGLTRLDGRLDINNGIALGGGAAATLGTIGGSGPTAAAQAQWVEIDINGTAHWIPVWV